MYTHFWSLGSSTEIKSTIMSNRNEQQNSSGSFWKFAFAATAGVVGAIGYHYYQKNQMEEEKKQVASASGQPKWAPDNVQNEICVICRSPSNATSRILDCGHVYHQACIMPYIQQSKKCPTCRQPVEIMSRR